MNLTKFAIRNYQFILTLVLVGIGIGLYSFLTMLRSEDPIIEFPIYTVVAVYPGTNPIDMETLVIDPIEDKLKEIEKVDFLVTKIVEGIGFIRVQAEYGIDINAKYEEVVAAVSRVQDQLPKDLYSLEVSKYSPSDAIIAQFAVYGEEASYTQLEAEAKKFQSQLERIKGIQKTELVALPQQEIRVALDLAEMAIRDISLTHIQQILTGNNANIPAGNLKMGSKIFSIKTTGSYQNIEDIRNTVVKAYEGNIVFLKDIAEVRFDFEDEKHIGRFNGITSIYLAITQKKRANVLEVSAEIKTKFLDFQNQLPANIEAEYAFEQAPAVEGRINAFFVNLLQGIALVGVTIFLFLGFRSSLVIMTVIPTAILMAIGALEYSGFALQQTSIAGLVIALGLLVDNGIVVIENIHRHLGEGKTLTQAAIQGTTEVGTAVISSTVTTIFAFFPLTQLGGGPGEFVKSLPIIVIFSLIASLLLALSFTPLASQKFLNKNSAEPTFLGKKLEWVITHGYRKVLQFNLRYPFPIILIGILSMVGSAVLFPIVGVSFFPKAEKPLLLIDIDTSEGTNIEKTNEATLFVEKILAKHDYVKHYAVNVGKSNPQVYYNRIPKNFAQNHGQILVDLKEWNRPKFNQLLDSLRADFKSYIDAKITVSEFANGPPLEAPIAIKAIGDNLDSLKNIANDLVKIIDNQEGTSNIVNPIEISKTDLKVKINKEKAGLLGLPLANIDFAVRTGLTGVNVGEVNFESGNQYNIVARLGYENEPTVADFDKIFVTNVLGKSVPLRQIAELEFTSSPPRIDHFNNRRAVTITADVSPEYNTVLLTQSLVNQLEKYPLPDGYEFYIAGEYESQRDSFGGLGQVLILAMLAIFIILILQFRSFSQPFVIFLAIPLAFTGSIVALFFANYSFSFLAFVGFTTLVGIVINDSIILVDYANQLMEKGKSKLDAIQEAAESRFTPIILTTMTTILGLLPLTLTNSDLWAPLGWTIIGGMLSATVMILLLVPVLMKWLTRKR